MPGQALSGRKHQRRNQRHRAVGLQRRTVAVGLRSLRLAGIERIYGLRLLTRHYATAVQMLGQGVQTRVFR